MEEALADTPVVVLQGARQVGKSTLAQAVIEGRPGAYVSLDDEIQRDAAIRDPVTFLERGSTATLVIDEVQRVPSLILAIKASVDRDRRPGRFLLTGSADLLRIAGGDSLAGRAETVELHGLSQGERRGRRERFIDRLLGGDLLLGVDGDLHRSAILELACAGGYPEASARPPGRRRAAWFSSYAARITDRDARDVSTLRFLPALPDLLGVMAASTSESTSVATLARSVGIAESTLPPYLDLLDTLYLTRRIPLWSNSYVARARRSRRSIMLDSGLAAALLHVNASSLATDVHPDPAGRIVETFVVGELIKQATWADTAVKVLHWSEPRKGEVDVVLESADGRLVGVEIKASATVGDSDFKGLRRFQQACGERFVAGVVLYCGRDAVPWGPKFAALPVSALWCA